ncbi:Neuromacin-like protein [Orchesella cincta]|uniref:Neuromacin-like protein n=1 Tax=Orchesella cincta TaxID=48709 RepID=A0A1D2M4G2_ORCCI|nr:Neuromacin-like protein [Orchesella cincta]
MLEFSKRRVKIAMKAWSLVRGWSSGATGVLWRDCAGRCRTCMGRESGQCVSGDFGCGATQQCQCSGGNVPRSTSWWDMQTCRWGL